MKLALALLIALATPAFALIEPPARYNKKYPGPVSVIEKPNTDAVTAECARIGVRQTYPQGILGCAKVIRGRCFIVIPNREFIASLPLAQRLGPERFRNILVRHERGHCLGWPKDHPGGHEVTP